MLRDASTPLLDEVVLAVGCTHEEAREVIRRLVLEESRAVLDERVAVA